MYGNIDSLFRIWHQATEASARSLDTVSRIQYPTLSLISSINAESRTIRVVDPVNPLLESPNLRRVRLRANQDTYFPEIGSTVICWYVEGVFSNGWWLPIENATNPPGEKENPLKDHIELFPGNVTLTVTDTFIVKTPSGCLIRFDKNGDVEISNLGNSITMSESNGIQIVSSDIVRINGKGIMVETGSDSDGDIMTSTGQ